MSPTAIGTEVEPTVRESVKSDMLGQKWPLATPTAIAKTIQRVKYRSSKESRWNPIDDEFIGWASDELAIKYSRSEVLVYENDRHLTS